MLPKGERTKIMETINLQKVEEKAIKLFGEKVVVSFAQIRVANKGYVVKINVQGLPFVISASAENLESAMDQAIYEFGIRVNKICSTDLFKTRPDESYEKVQLSDEQLEKLYRFEEYLSDDYLKELKEKTTTWVCQLKDERYECVIESPYKNLHSRGMGTSKQTAIMSALWKAHDVFEPQLIKVGQDIMK